MSEPAEASPPSGTLLRVATFAAGLLVGAAMVYLSPPPGGEGGPMGPPPGAEGAPPGEGGPMGPPLGGAPSGKEAGPGTTVGGGGQPAAGSQGPPPGGEGPPPGGEGPPPGGEGPPPGAEGPPPGEAPPSTAGATPGGEGPAGPPLPEGADQGPGADWLGKHLETAAQAWTTLADQAAAQGKAELAKEMRAMAAAAPKTGDRPPPLDRVVVFLSNERILVERARAAGVDTSALERQISPLMR